MSLPRAISPLPDRWDAPLELRGADATTSELVLRSARPHNGEALQDYVRTLSPQSRYNRFFGAASELPPIELTRAITANDQDRITLLLVLQNENNETIVGEARMAIYCDQRSGEFGMSLGDAWRNRGLGSALLRRIEQRAAGDGVETLVADTLRTNESMIGLARARGYRMLPGLEARTLRISKRLADVPPEPPCRNWRE